MLLLRLPVGVVVLVQPRVQGVTFGDSEGQDKRQESAGVPMKKRWLQLDETGEAGGNSRSTEVHRLAYPGDWHFGSYLWDPSSWIVQTSFSAGDGSIAGLNICTPSICCRKSSR